MSGEYFLLAASSTGAAMRAARGQLKGQQKSPLMFWKQVAVAAAPGAQS
jgi:hypothetical protein